jgi:hypothetical protein
MLVAAEVVKLLVELGAPLRGAARRKKAQRVEQGRFMVGGLLVASCHLVLPSLVLALRRVLPL